MRCGFKIISLTGLERNLVTNGQHDDAVLCLCIPVNTFIILENVAQAEVVTGIDHEVADLVRQTQRNGAAISVLW